jgi:hypothetical protein
MEIKLNNNIIPVLGWCDVSECSCYEALAEDMNVGESIIFNTPREFEDGQLCAFMFYFEFNKQNLHSVFSGTVKFIGRHPDHEAPFAYIFYPEKKVNIKGVGYCKCCGKPEEVILKSKKV